MLKVHFLHSRKRGLIPSRDGTGYDGPAATVLGKIWRQLALASNWPVVAGMTALSLVGVLSIYAYKPEEGIKQSIFLVAGLIGMGLFQVVNYQVLGRWAWGFYVGSFVLIIYTVVGGFTESHGLALPGVHKVNGACAWINFRFSASAVFSLQPAELMKIAFVMVMARYLRFRSNYRSLQGLLAPFALAVVPLMAILKQPDLGTALVFIPCLFAMLFVAGAKLRHLLGVAGMGMVVGPILWMAGTNVPVLKHLPTFVKDYQRDRVYAMFSRDPRTLRGVGFQQEHSLTALGSGGVAGKGWGNIPVGKGVPEGDNDMIFAVIGEQFGFFGAAVVLGAYIVFFAGGVEIAGNTREPFGRLVAVGIVSMLATQTFMNLAVTLRLMPVTGVTLPFVSYGGSSLLSSFLCAGLLLNIGQNRPLIMARNAFEYDPPGEP